MKLHHKTKPDKRLYFQFILKIKENPLFYTHEKLPNSLSFCLNIFCRKIGPNFVMHCISTQETYIITYCHNWKEIIVHFLKLYYNALIE